MTLKQKLFTKKYLETGNGTQAVLEAYNTHDPNTAAVIASENLNKPKVIEEIYKVLDRTGLSLEQVSGSVGDILQRGAETKVTGDNILRAAEMLYKLHGVYPIQKSAHFRLNVRQELEKKSFNELIDLKRQKSQEIDEILAS